MCICQVDPEEKRDDDRPRLLRLAMGLRADDVPAEVNTVKTDADPVANDVENTDNEEPDA